MYVFYRHRRLNPSGEVPSSIAVEGIPRSPSDFTEPISGNRKCAEASHSHHQLLLGKRVEENFEGACRMAVWPVFSSSKVGDLTGRVYSPIFRMV